MRACAERSTGINAASGDIVHGLSEQCLVEAAKNGHSTAFDTLSGRYRQQLLRAARRITRSTEDAEDAVQDTLLRAFVHMRDFDGRSSFGTWLTRIAINSALMNLRKKRASREIATDYGDEMAADGVRCEISDWRPNPERRCAQSEEENRLRKAIQDLRPALRAVVQKQVLQENSLQETAEAIGISVSAAKGRLFHAKKALRRLMTPKLKKQFRCNGQIRTLTAGKWLVRNAETNTVRRSTRFNHKKKGEEYVVETEGTRKYGGRNHIHSGGEGRDFSRELGA
jgi:RNA polymerase sigma factor (sigma-70 family)